MNLEFECKNITHQICIQNRGFEKNHETSHLFHIPVFNYRLIAYVLYPSEPSQRSKQGLAEYLSWVNLLEVLLILTGKYLKKLAINYMQGKFFNSFRRVMDFPVTKQNCALAEE